MFAKILLQALLLTSLIAPAAIQGSPIMAEVATGCKVYSDKTLNFPMGELCAGQLVEILEDYSCKVYKISEPEGTITGWVSAEFLNIPPDAPIDKSTLTRIQLENFANGSNYSSQTDYLIIADIARQKTYIFIKNSGHWSLLRIFACSTGINASPTTRGSFIISDRGSWFYSERLAAGAAHWLRFNGQYLFHSIPMDKHKNIIQGENIVGEKRSSGCIRLMPDNAKWLFDNIPSGTAVIII